MTKQGLHGQLNEMAQQYVAPIVLIVLTDRMPLSDVALRIDNAIPRSLRRAVARRGLHGHSFTTHATIPHPLALIATPF